MLSVDGSAASRCALFLAPSPRLSAVGFEASNSWVGSFGGWLVGWINSLSIGRALKVALWI